MRPFLSAAWRRLVLFNYRIPPDRLLPYLPAHTELDFWNDTCYVSLVGFMFQNTRVKGIQVPFHVHFEEVNLRFYVRRQDPETGDWRHGVVFIREIVPKPAIAWVANALYRERYVWRRMWHRWAETDQLEIEYGWREAGQWQAFGVRADKQPEALKPGSEAAFITEHYWGYARRDARRTVEYQVERPNWQVYPVRAWHTNVDFGKVYGPAFSVLTEASPLSIFLAEGSEITVREGRLIL